jgi:hypothetical protein
MQENLDVFDFQLTSSEHKAIDALDRQERIWRDRPKLAGLFGTVKDGVLTIPEGWPHEEMSLGEARPDVA